SDVPAYTNPNSVTRLRRKSAVEGKMSTTSNIYSYGRIRQVLYILVWIALLTGTTCGQSQQNQPEKLAYGVDRANVPDAIAKVKSGEFGGIHVDLITRAGAVEA